ncbi:MAG: hypothetical protein ACRC6E_08515 [Fusobacteriaceae bacterium]
MFKVGDKVYDIKFGFGEVVEIRECGLNNVGVKFGNFVRFYTQYGFYGAIDFNRSLFFEEIEIPVSALTRPRWRALKGGVFWYVSAFGIATKGIDYYSICDDTLNKVGNYFKTEEETEESRFYKVFHDGEKNV